MDLTPLATTILVVIAGPVGITLGWWRRSGRRPIYREMWEYIDRFTQLARTDLGIAEDDAFTTLKPVIRDRLTFEGQVADPTDIGKGAE